MEERSVRKIHCFTSTNGYFPDCQLPDINAKQDEYRDSHPERSEGFSPFMCWSDFVATQIENIRQTAYTLRHTIRYIYIRRQINLSNNKLS